MGSINVKTQKGCKWSASSNVSWIKTTSANSGYGSGTINYIVHPNSRTSSTNTSSSTILKSRTGIISVADKTLKITQSKPITQACTYSISPTVTQSFPATGGMGSTNVKTQKGCKWNASSSVSWVRIVSGSSGTGNGTVSYTVSKNSNTSSSSTNTSSVVAPRTSTITIAGKTLKITQ